jgi:hypothetical protein
MRRATVPAPAARNPAATEYQRSAARAPWWQTEESFVAHETARTALQKGKTSYFRFGDEVLELAVDDPSVLDSVRAQYGECELNSLDRVNSPLIRCVVSAKHASPLIAIHFLQAPHLDLATLALGLSHPPRGASPYTIGNAQRSGWSLIGGAEHSIVAASRIGLLLDPKSVADDFVADYLVAATLSTQTNLIVLHAAAIELGSKGAILTGASHAGKTTTSVHLALSGHRLLGDEMAIVRIGSQELLPLRKSLNLRAGPRSAALTRAVQRVRPRNEHSTDGTVGPIRIDELVPGAVDGPVGLKAVFFLDGFAGSPSVEPFTLSLNDDVTFDYMSANDIASISWGLEPQRRTLRLLALKQLMARVRCWKLCVGPPDETVKLIESTMEEQ